MTLVQLIDINYPKMALLGTVSATNTGNHPKLLFFQVNAGNPVSIFLNFLLFFMSD